MMKKNFGFTNITASRPFGNVCGFGVVLILLQPREEMVVLDSPLLRKGVTACTIYTGDVVEYRKQQITIERDDDINLYKEYWQTQAEDKKEQ